MNSSILEDFESTTSKLITILSSLDEEALNKVPFKNSWTAGQVGDHLYKSYNIIKVLNGNVEITERSPDKKLADIQKLFLDFTSKMEAPKETIPTDEYIKKDPLINSLHKRIDQHLEVIRTKDLSKLCVDFGIPGYGLFTRLEWIGFNTVHTKRHIHQLNTIIDKMR